jgi:hypothetical protein
LEFEFDLNIAYSDSVKTTKFFNNSKFPYEFDIPNELIKDTMTFYRYHADICYHFKLEFDNNNGVSELKHLALPLESTSILYSPIRLIKK